MRAEEARSRGAAAFWDSERNYILLEGDLFLVIILCIHCTTCTLGRGTILFSLLIGGARGGNILHAT